MRKPYIAGNWKMNKTAGEAAQLVEELIDLVGDSSDVDVMVAPPFTALSTVGKKIQGSGIMLGAQNFHYEPSGAYTGEISADMLKECGCSWVIIGHSERRQYFGCTDELVNRKLKSAVKQDLNPVVCIGETLSQREDGRAFDVIREQLKEGLKDLSDREVKTLTLAYEPVWAIGTGKTATPRQAEEVHGFIREELGKMYGNDAAENTRILYGGSVKPGNISSLMDMTNVDGGLVGGASLKAGSFSEIINFNK